MTRLAFLLLGLLVPDRGPESAHGHITTIRRGILYCSLPGQDEGPYKPLTIENNSPFPATITYRNETFRAEGWSTTIYDHR